MLALPLQSLIFKFSYWNDFAFHTFFPFIHRINLGTLYSKSLAKITVFSKFLFFKKGYWLVTPSSFDAISNQKYKSKSGNSENYFQTKYLVTPVVPLRVVITKIFRKTGDFRQMFVDGSTFGYPYSLETKLRKMIFFILSIFANSWKIVFGYDFENFPLRRKYWLWFLNYSKPLNEITVLNERALN